MRTHAITISGLVVGLLAASPAASLEGGADGASAAAGAPRLHVEEGTLHLALDDALEIALTRNLSLSIERRRVEESSLAVDEGRGIYDLSLETEATVQDLTSPALSNVDGVPVIDSARRNFNFGLSQLTPLGGQARLSWTGFRNETTSLDSRLNPAYDVGLSFSYRQPLLRDFGRVPTDRGILVARNRANVSRETFEQQAARVLQEVANAYWALVEAIAQLEVAEQGLELARELHEMNKVKVEVGTLAPLELVQSEVGMATREEEIVLAQARVDDATDRLRLLLNLERGALWQAPIHPETDPETEPIEVDLDDALALALDQRPELRARRHTVRSLEIDAAFFKNQRQPRLDLVLGYGWAGVGGNLVLERDPETGEILEALPGGFSDAMSQITSQDFARWWASVNLTLPLQDRAGRARKASAEVALERGQLELEELRQTIRGEVRAAARGVETAAKQIERARISSRLAERNLEAERQRYEAGLSTSFQVLQIQEDLTAARSREVSAVAGYRRALAELFRATGQLPTRHGIELEG